MLKCIVAASLASLTSGTGDGSASTSSCQEATCKSKLAGPRVKAATESLLIQASSKLSAASDDEVQEHVAVKDNLASGTKSCDVSSTISMPNWLASILGLLTDVDLYCDFPRDEDVFDKIDALEDSIVKRSSSITLRPNRPIHYQAVPSSRTGQDLYDALQAGNGMDSLKAGHLDSCNSDAAFPSAATAAEIYENIKAMVDGFDIFSKCTKVYARKNEHGIAKIKKDDVIAVSTLIALGHYSLSYEDVAHYDEEVNGNERTLSVVVSSRKENVIEGNYDITLSLRGDYVELTYTKRQNLAEALLASQCDHNCYEVATQRSVDLTILKLAYAGLYGPSAVSFDNSGCRQDTSSCKGFSTLQLGDICSDHEQCQTSCCKRTAIFQWNKVCVDAASCR